MRHRIVDFWQRLTIIGLALDWQPVALFVSLFAITEGALLTIDAPPSAYLFDLIPINLFGAILVAMGILQINGLLMDQLHMVQFGTFAAFLGWCILTAVAVLRQDVLIVMLPFNFLLALGCAWCFLRMSWDAKRLAVTRDGA